MPDIHRITDLDDPRLAPYRRLKERELQRQDSRFIAESEHVVRRLLASDYPVESVLCCERRAYALALEIAARPDTPLYVVPNDLVNQIVGFKFHSGVIACGLRKPAAPLDTLIGPPAKRSLIVICPDLISHENLGSIIRIAAAFGAAGLLLGQRCCDPFYRMSIRVSMGTIFSLPIAHSADLIYDLTRLRSEFAYETVASVLAPDAEPLTQATKPDRIALLLGNEAQGLDAPTIAACTRRVTLPMREGVDSLNVAVAAGIFIHHFRATI